ncbi:universal stress protein [Marivita sp. S0852]|uniref:universal stress protein n=1 Tax=Marivita sp. S0852 TaxID=3373893 RepID=UPI00398205DC
MYKHILVAADDSELALKGLEHAVSLAKSLDAKLTILTVSEPMQPDAAQAAWMAGVKGATDRYEEQLERKAQERFAVFRERAEEHGIQAGLAHEIDTSPAEAIVRTARLKACDLIVMSSHGRRGVQKMLLGSQTSEVLVKTSVPVLVIR